MGSRPGGELSRCELSGGGGALVGSCPCGESSWWGVVQVGVIWWGVALVGSFPCQESSWWGLSGRELFGGELSSGELS